MAMRILYLSPHPTHDTFSDVGYSTHQREMINALRELGHEVIPEIIGNYSYQTVEVGNSDVIEKQQISVRGKMKKFIPTGIWQAAKDIAMRKHDKGFVRAKFEKAIVENQPDVIYERSEMLCSSGVILANKYKIPHFYEVNGPGVEEMAKLEGQSLLETFAHRFEQRKFRLSNGLFTVSSAMKDYLKEEYRVKESKINVMPNAFDPSAFRPLNKEEKAEMKMKLGLNSGLIIGFIGSILPFHGVELLIDAFKEVSDIHQQSQLLIVGSGSGFEEMKAYVESAFPPNKVVFTGQVPHADAYKYIDVMDVAVMATSNWYGSPVKIFEYGAMNKAIIAPNVDPVRDVMRNEEDGLLIDSNIEQLKVAIIRLLGDSGLRSDLARNFHKKVWDHHTWQQNAKSVVEIIEK